LTSYRDVVKRVLPAVVSIRVVSTAKAKPANADAAAPDVGDLPFDGDLRRFMDELRKRQRGMDVPVQQFGSGVVVDPKGIVVTNNHVVSGAEQVEVIFTDGKKLRSKSVVFDPRTDLAIVRLETTSPLPAAELGNSDEMEIGDRVLAMGAPFGLAGSVSQGIVSAKSRNLNLNFYEDFLQTDAAINPGNSGGPLVNLGGQVIGINTAIKSQNGGFQGVGMAVPSNMVREVVSQLKDGKVRRGYLGVQMQDLSPDVAEKLNIQEKQGVVVMSVHEGAPAAKAGLKEGDIVVAVAGKEVDGGKTLQRIVRTAPLDKPSSFTVIRDGKRQEIKVVLEAMPDEYGLAREEFTPRRRSKAETETVQLDKLGLDVADLSTDLAEQFGYKNAKGAVIIRVEPNSLAQLAGLRPGMLITGVEKKAVDSVQAVQEAIKGSSLQSGVLLRVRTPQGGSRYVILKEDA
jgi:serine protease Do